MSTPALRIQHVSAPTARTADTVRALVSAVPGAADNPPISERGLLNLETGLPFRHLLAVAGDDVLGYAQLDRAEDETGAELVTLDPAVADALVAEILTVTTAEPLRLWAHGEASLAVGAAERGGLMPVRKLLQLRCPMAELRLDDTAAPAGVRIRAFVPGRDDASWLRVNARAFADHPEQGSWTQADLADRINSSWFDPAGFLVAERIDAPGELIGYHWTKRHPAETAAGQPDDPAAAVGGPGEVYVLGVDPDAQGLRLGSVLLSAGLAHLRDQGVQSVLLYVDESNATAYQLYLRLGFSVFATDIQYARAITS